MSSLNITDWSTRVDHSLLSANKKFFKCIANSIAYFYFVLIHLELKTINFCEALDSETSTKNSYLISSPQPAVRVLYLVRVL